MMIKKIKKDVTYPVLKDKKMKNEVTMEKKDKNKYLVACIKGIFIGL